MANEETEVPGVVLKLCLCFYFCVLTHIKQIEHNKLIVYLILNEDCYFLFRIAA